jgi:hypothetical protein
MILVSTPSPRGDYTNIDQSAISQFIFLRRPTYPQNFAPCDNFPLYKSEVYVESNLGW